MTEHTARVEVRREGVIGHLVLDNPERLNALTPTMLAQLPECVATLAGDAEVRVVVISGAGQRAFASGLDLRALGAASPATIRVLEDHYRDACRALRDFAKPTIAAIGGHCIGGGLGLALETDFRVCGQSSSFAIPAARLGIAYSDVGPLVRAVGSAWAAEILFSGRVLSSADAVASGLVNRSVADDELGATAIELARQIGRGAPLALSAMKAALAAHRDGTPEAGVIQAFVKGCYDSADLAEGLAAIAESRPPVFVGR